MLAGCLTRKAGALLSALLLIITATAPGNVFALNSALLAERHVDLRRPRRFRRPRERSYVYDHAARSVIADL